MKEAILQLQAVNKLSWEATDAEQELIDIQIQEAEQSLLTQVQEDGFSELCEMHSQLLTLRKENKDLKFANGQLRDAYNLQFQTIQKLLTSQCKDNTIT